MSEALTRDSRWMFLVHQDQIKIIITVEDSDGVPYAIELEPMHFLAAEGIAIALQSAIMEAMGLEGPGPAQAGKTH